VTSLSTASSSLRATTQFHNRILQHIIYKFCIKVKEECVWDLSLSLQRRWRWCSSGLWCHVDSKVCTVVSEKEAFSFFMTEVTMLGSGECGPEEGQPSAFIPISQLFHDCYKMYSFLSWSFETLPPSQSRIKIYLLPAKGFITEANLWLYPFVRI
jgi:hypothetical protein